MVKRTFMMAILLVAPITMSKAQGLFFEGNLGYGLSLASNQIATESTIELYTLSGTVISDEVKGSYGAGINFGLNVGYMLNSNFGFGLNTNFVAGKKYTANSSVSDLAFAYSSRTDFESSSRMLRFVPNVILRAGEGKFSPYAKIGLAFGTMGSVTWHVEYSNSNPDSEIETSVFSGGLAFGGFGEFGVAMNINDNMSLAFSSTLYSMNWAPKRWVLTEYTQDGIDQLPSMTIYDKEVEFTDHIEEDAFNPPNQGKPDQELKFYLPFSSMGFNLTFRYSL